MSIIPSEKKVRVRNRELRGDNFSSHPRPVSVRFIPIPTPLPYHPSPSPPLRNRVDEFYVVAKGSVRGGTCPTKCRLCAVVTAETARCRVGQPITLRVQTGYLSSSVTTESGRGAADCPWRLTVEPGQRINLTLINFARVSVPTDWAHHHTPGPTPPAADAAAAAAAGRPRPKVCYQLANLRERRYTRVLTECEGSARTSHAFLSTSNVMEVDIIVAKVLKVHFLLHFQGELPHDHRRD